MTPAWVLVTGDFGREGGQDSANFALASFLAARGTPVHLVAHRIAEPLASHPAVRLHPVARPLGWHLLGQGSLDREGRRVAAAVRREHPGARVVVNGGNCRFPDVTWVHMVHAAWEPLDPGAPLLAKLKNRVSVRLDRRDERRALGASRLVIANSERTRRDILALGVDPARVHVIYLGSDPGTDAPPTPEERRAAREAFGVPPAASLAAFVGALGYERKKGFDTLLASLRILADGGTDVRVVAAGGGALAFWQRAIDAARLGERVRLLGHTDRVKSLLAAADLLVSPTRYDAYGLGVQEALCRGIPAIVSTRAGVSERYPPALRELLLPDPDDAPDLARRIASTLEGRERLRPHLLELSATLLRWTWNDTAEAIVRRIEEAA